MNHADDASLIPPKQIQSFQRKRVHGLRCRRFCRSVIPWRVLETHYFFLDGVVVREWVCPNCSTVLREDVVG